MASAGFINSISRPLVSWFCRGKTREVEKIDLDFKKESDDIATLPLQLLVIVCSFATTAK